jgi:virginiamycin B lyase
MPMMLIPGSMIRRMWLESIRAIGILCAILAGLSNSLSATIAPRALVGLATSAANGPLEGISVIAQAAGSNVLTAVMTAADGRYYFPRRRLVPGRYTITIRAAGYELPETKTIIISTNDTIVFNLKLVPVTDRSKLASQLTDQDWLNSFPGTQEQKDSMVHNPANCSFCHSLERIARSTYDAEQYLPVIQRMLTYDVDYGGSDSFQVTSPPPAIEGMTYWQADAKKLAEYLASINLSGGKSTWNYKLTASERPSGAATRAIVSVYPIPRQPSAIHDLDVDRKGRVWYGNSRWDYIGRLNPQTGRFAEWPAPNFMPFPTDGTQHRSGVLDIQVDPNGDVWPAIGGSRAAKFEVRSQKWRIFDLHGAVLSGFISPFRAHDHTVWLTDLDFKNNVVHQTAFRLDIKSGAIESRFPIFENQLNDSRSPARSHFCYNPERDANDDFVCTDASGSAIIRLNAKTGEALSYPTPTPSALPRRGYVDGEWRFWFGEYYADKVGVFDLKTNSFREYPIPTDYISPYYARPDNKGSIWVSSLGSDRLIRLDPISGKSMFYLMPVRYDARKVVVDPSAKAPTIWFSNKNVGQLMRVEVPD